MAKLKMKKLELIAPLTDSKKIIELIQRRGVVELCGNEDSELETTNVTAVISEFERFRTNAENALEILNKYAPCKKPITEMFGGLTEIEKHDFGDKAAQLEKIMNGAADIIRSSKTITEANSETAQLTMRSDMLEPWIKLDVPLNFKGTSKTAAFIGSLPAIYTAEDLETQICSFTPPEEGNTARENAQSCAAEVISSSKGQTNVFILCSKEIQAETEEALRKISFVPVSETPPYTAAELIQKNSDRIAELAELSEQARKNIISMSNIREDIEFAVDFLSMRTEKYEALSKLGITGTTFVLNGYIPEKYTESLRKEIEKKYTAIVNFTDPSDDEEVPVLLENSKFSAPVEGITKMYAMPSKSDVDPTPYMSFFYYVLFGMMLSDAGYGLLMTIGTMIVLAKFKLDDNMRKTMTMFRNCGICTTIWGALFGSWFGDIVQVVAREFFDKEIGSIALWFEPLTDPIKLLLFSFGIGIIHLFIGVGVSFKMSWDEGKKVGAFLDTVPIYLTITGVAPLAASILTEVPDILKTIGTYMMAAGVVILVLTAGRSSKSIFGKLFGGLYALYNTATGYLGDILSYSRLLALGLATGCIASVINLIGVMPENKIVKLILLVVVFIIGHAANLAINLLGAYVHTDRLQFVELFSKFYTGGGREFTPFGVNTKYIKFKEEKINE